MESLSGYYCQLSIKGRTSDRRQTTEEASNKYSRGPDRSYYIFLDPKQAGTANRKEK